MLDTHRFRDHLRAELYRDELLCVTAIAELKAIVPATMMQGKACYQARTLDAFVPAAASIVCPTVVLYESMAALCAEASWPELWMMEVARHVRVLLDGEYVAREVARAVLSPVAVVMALWAAAGTMHKSPLP